MHCHACKYKWISFIEVAYFRTNPSSPHLKKDIPAGSQFLKLLNTLLDSAVPFHVLIDSKNRGSRNSTMTYDPFTSQIE